jgi:hypothetical protein
MAAVPAVSAELRDLLSAAEIAWLEAGNSAELAALRPARLMKAIYQGFARANRSDLASTSGDASAGGDVGFIWIHDSGAHVYAADSFG